MELFTMWFSDAAEAASNEDYIDAGLLLMVGIFWLPLAVLAVPFVLLAWLLGKFMSLFVSHDYPAIMATDFDFNIPADSEIVHTEFKLIRDD